MTPTSLPFDWEMSPRYRILDSEVHRVTFAGKTRWQFHLVKQSSQDYAFLWLRPFNFGADGGFVIFDENADREHIFGANETLQSLERRIYSLIGADALARRFVLNTADQLRHDNQRAHEILTVTRDGVATSRTRMKDQGRPFRWRHFKTPLTGAEFVQIPVAQIWADVQTLFADADGEATFARAFARLNPTQRRARVQRPTRGTLDELNRLLHDVVLASPQWESLDEGSELYFSIDKSGKA